MAAGDRREIADVIAQLANSNEVPVPSILGADRETDVDAPGPLSDLEF
jgi:hypothetical protein